MSRDEHHSHNKFLETAAPELKSTNDIRGSRGKTHVLGIIPPSVEGGMPLVATQEEGSPIIHLDDLAINLPPPGTPEWDAAMVKLTDGQLVHNATVGTLTQEEFYEGQEKADGGIVTDFDALALEEEESPTPLTPTEQAEFEQAVTQDHAATQTLSDELPEGDVLTPHVPPPDASPEDIEVVKTFLKDPKARAESLTQAQKALAVTMLFGEKGLADSQSANLNTLFRDMKRMQREYPILFGRHVHLKKRSSKTRNKKRH